MYHDIPQQSEISENLFHNITNANIIRPNKIYLSCLFEIDSQSKKKKKKRFFLLKKKWQEKKISIKFPLFIEFFFTILN